MLSLAVVALLRERRHRGPRVLPADLAIGDLLAVAATGAYCYAMSSNYNCARPAVVAVAPATGRTRRNHPAGRPIVVLRRETDDDLMLLETR